MIAELDTGKPQPTSDVQSSCIAGDAQNLSTSECYALRRGSKKEDSPNHLQDKVDMKGVVRGPKE